MADVRKSAKQTAARTRAREKATEFRAKQDKLEQLATDSLEEIEASTQKEIAAVHERAAKKARPHRPKPSR